jgi:threonine dehydratase
LSHDYQNVPVLEDIQQAARRIDEWINPTPVLCSRRLDAATGARLYFKCENFQHTGAFKFRGACNAVFSMDQDEAAAGVATHSSGNHGAALARAASLRGIPAHIVVPDGAVAAKLEAIAAYGGVIHTCADTNAAREQGLEQVLAETGAQAVPPYNDSRIICGQGTAALEFLSQQPGLEVLVTPLGGGGLVCGSAIAAKSLDSAIEVIGVEPVGAADTFDSLAAGHIIEEFTPNTIADGLRAKVGPLTFKIIQQRVDRVLTVGEDEIIGAMREIWRIMKIIAEPSSATVLAAVRSYPDAFRGRKVGLIISGGNVDLDHLPWMAGRSNEAL